ncbi:ribonuclease H-like domain-containing protein [Tanacetum coccineum]
MPPEDEVLPAEERPLPAAVSPTVDSLGYVPESDPMEDLEEDEMMRTCGGSYDYLPDREETIAMMMMIVALPAVDHALSAEETESFETDESAATPPPHPAYRVTTRISIRDEALHYSWSDTEFVASMFGEVHGEGASLSIEVEEEEALAISGGSRFAVKMGGRYSTWRSSSRIPNGMDSISWRHYSSRKDTVMSDSEDSTVTYTAVSSPFADLPDIGSPGFLWFGVFSILDVWLLILDLIGSSVVDSINNLDDGNPLHVQNSDNSNSVIIPFKLLGTENYRIWSVAVKLALQARNKYGFVDGSCLKESYATNVYMGLVYSKNYAVVWKELRETYDKVNGSAVYNLLQKIYSVKQVVMLPVRSSLLIRDPLLEVKDTYNVISREESHRGVPESSGGT